MTLPFIPDDFVTQKNQKNLISKSRARNKRQKIEQPEEIKPYRGWVTKMAPDTDASDDGIDSFFLHKYT